MSSPLLSSVKYYFISVKDQALCGSGDTKANTSSQRGLWDNKHINVGVLVTERKVYITLTNSNELKATKKSINRKKPSRSSSSITKWFVFKNKGHVFSL